MPYAGKGLATDNTNLVLQAPHSIGVLMSWLIKTNGLARQLKGLAPTVNEQLINSPPPHAMWGSLNEIGIVS